MLDEYLERLKTTWRGPPDLTLAALTNDTIRVTLSRYIPVGYSIATSASGLFESQRSKSPMSSLSLYVINQHGLLIETCKVTSI